MDARVDRTAVIAASRRFLGALDQVLIHKPAQVPGHSGITHLHGEGAVAVEIGRTRRGIARGVVVQLAVTGRRGPPRGSSERPQGSSILAVSSLISVQISLIAR